MNIADKLALLAKFPGSLQALFTDRGPGEEAMAQTIEDLVKDSFSVAENGDLFCSNDCFYTLIWKDDRSAWINLDDL